MLDYLYWCLFTAIGQWAANNALHPCPGGLSWAAATPASGLTPELEARRHEQLRVEAGRPPAGWIRWSGNGPVQAAASGSPPKAGGYLPLSMAEDKSFDGLEIHIFELHTSPVVGRTFPSQFKRDPDDHPGTANNVRCLSHHETDSPVQSQRRRRHHLRASPGQLDERGRVPVNPHLEAWSQLVSANTRKFVSTPSAFVTA